MNNFRKLAVNISGADTYGSGFLFKYKTDEGLVITAKHCVYNAEKKANYSDLAYLDYDQEALTVRSSPIYPQDETLDLAVIKVRLTKDYGAFSYGIEPEHQQKIATFGFPSFMSQEVDTGILQWGVINEVQEGKFNATLTQDLHSFEHSGYDNLAGCSGSGVYVELDGKCYLVGILTTLLGQGRRGLLECIAVQTIRDFIEQEVGLLFLPDYLQSFQQYLEKMVQFLKKEGGSGQKLGALLEDCYQQHMAELTPLDIHQRLDKYLFLPYDKALTHNHETLWLGWLGLLLCKWKQQGATFQIDAFFNLVNPQNNQSGMHLLFTKETMIQSFIRCLFNSDLYEKFGTEDVVFVNNDNRRFSGALIARKDQIEGIVKSIDDIQLERNFYIDTGEEPKCTPVMHLAYLENELQPFLFANHLSTRELDQAIIEKLDEIFQLIET